MDHQMHKRPMDHQIHHQRPRCRQVNVYSPVCHVCGINTFMQMHPYNAIDISLHHIKLKFVQALVIQIIIQYYSVMS